MSMEYFGNDKYRVLLCMAQRQIAVNSNMVVKLSQQEMAEIVHMSKMKVNGIISELKNDGYICQQGLRGKYSLTTKATEALASEQNGGGENHGK